MMRNQEELLVLNVKAVEDLPWIMVHSSLDIYLADSEIVNFMVTILHEDKKNLFLSMFVKSYLLYVY